MLLSLGLIDKGISWLGDYNLALPAVILVNVWKGIPFFTLTLLSGLKAIDAGLYDAAAVDGANAWQRFVNITLPGVRYVVIVACLLSLIFTLNAFGLIYLLTGGGPGGATRVFSILAYEIFNERRYSLATAVAMAIVPALLVLIVILGRYMRGDPSRLEARPTLLSQIGSWALLALITVVSMVVLVQTVQPLALLAVLLLAIVGVAYVMNGDRLGKTDNEVWLGLVRSVVVVLGASALSVLVFNLGFTFFALALFALVSSNLFDRLVGSRNRDSAQATALNAADYQRKLGRVRLIGRFGRIGIGVALASLLFFELFPFYWVIVTALKTDEQIRTFRSVFWPAPFSTENFRYMLQETQFIRWFWNTVQVALVSCLVSVIVGALGAYALVRLKWRFAGFLSTAILFTYLLPGIIILIPLYQIFTSLHLINTLASADDRLSDLRPAVRLLAADGLLPGDPDGTGGGGADRRLQPLPGVLPGDPAADRARPADGRPLRADRGVQRLPLRLRLRPPGVAQYSVGRTREDGDRRHLPLRADDGRLDHDGDTGHSHLHAGAALHGRRADGGLGQGLSRTTGQTTDR